MIGLDTNVLVRLFIDDDIDQARQARRFVAEKCTSSDPGFVNRVALCEMIWVLSGAYGYDRPAIARVVQELLASRDIRFEDHTAVGAALSSFKTQRIDFADALTADVNRARGCKATATFDRRAAKLDGFVRVV